MIRQNRRPSHGAPTATPKKTFDCLFNKVHERYIEPTTAA
jgi:hypothetical protein